MRLFFSSFLVVFMVFGNSGWAQEDEDPPKVAPPATEPEEDPPKKEEKKPVEKKGKKDEKKEKGKKDESPLAKSLSALKVKDKPLVFDKTFVPALLALGNTSDYTRDKFPVYAYVVPSTELGVEAHCGVETGYIGSQDGWGIFASTRTGSGLALGYPQPVVFLPVSKDGRYGTPVVLPGKDTGNGFYSYLGTGTGLYLVPSVPVQ